MSLQLASQNILDQAEEALVLQYKNIDKIALLNQAKVLEAFRTHRLSEEFFAEKTGYGRADAGRETIDKIFASVFKAETAAVRLQIVSGTHAIACALFGNLRSGERLACLTGRPYDTLGSVIGTSENDKGSLKSLGINYLEADIEPYLKVHDSLESFLEPLVSKPTAIAYIQKSCGYSFGRRALSCHDIGRVSNVVHRINPDCAVLVDNCYGEFVEPEEPCAVGADLVVGSLIKNPGGGLALTGGYIAGRTNLVNASLNRLTCPGIGGHMGLTYNQNRLMLQGLFQAPSIVSQALKGAHLFAYVFSQLGLSVSPGPFDSRADIIQAIQFGTPERLINFCRAIQKCSPVNAHVLPEPAAMPGYPQEIIMAGGTFIEGATIELSADGPLRSPFAAFVQGGLSYLHVKHALQEALELARSGKLAFLDG